MKKNIGVYKDLYAKNCEILEVLRNKVVVKISSDETLIARKIGNLKRGDKVNIYEAPFLDRMDEVLIYSSPLYYLFLGIVFGFLFPVDTYSTYHFLLIIGLTFLGFIQLFVIRNILKKQPKTKFIALDENIILKENQSI